jgi:MFS family permease
MIGSGVGGLVMAAFGWRFICLSFGVMTLAWLYPWSRIQFVEIGEPTKQVPAVSLGTILRQSALQGTCVGHFGNNYGMYFIMTWLPLFLLAERGWTIEVMAVPTANLFAIQALTAFLSGFLSDWLIAIGLHEGRFRKAFEIASNLVKATAIVGIATAHGQMVMIVWLALTAAMIGLATAQNLAISQIFAGKRAAGRWVGLRNFAANTVGIIGPIVAGVLLDATHSYRIAFIVAGAITLSSVFAWAVLVPRVEPIAWDARDEPAPIGASHT